MENEHHKMKPVVFTMEEGTLSSLGFNPEVINTTLEQQPFKKKKPSPYPPNTSKECNMTTE